MPVTPLVSGRKKWLTVARRYVGECRVNCQPNTFGAGENDASAVAKFGMARRTTPRDEQRRGGYVVVARSAVVCNAT
jgi:hypothetical protein